MRLLGSFRYVFLALLMAEGPAVGPYAKAGDGYVVLHSFGKGKDGAGVYAGVALDDQGNLYGTTSGGGAYNSGTVFELTPGAGGKWTETILHNFCKDFPRCKDGALPSTTPVLDSAGKLYGTSNAATFEMRRKAGGWNFLVLCDCITPSIFDAVGNLYGIGGPGTHQAGAVAELSRISGGWKETLLYSFCSQSQCRDGEPPEWGATLDSAGNLYGTTKFGGNSSTQWCPTSGGCGVAYNAGLTADSKGNVYGTTLQGGISGTVFKLSPQQNGHWKETILYDFPNPEKNGGAPAGGGVTFDNLGNLYGTASAGGEPNCDCGVVFKMTPQADGTWSYTVLHRFKGTDGVGPGYNLVFDKNYKHLYGTTVEGGSGGYGVVYEITP